MRPRTSVTYPVHTAGACEARRETCGRQRRQLMRRREAHVRQTPAPLARGDRGVSGFTTVAFAPRTTTLYRRAHGDMAMCPRSLLSTLRLTRALRALNRGHGRKHARSTSGRRPVAPAVVADGSLLVATPQPPQTAPQPGVRTAAVPPTPSPLPAPAASLAAADKENVSSLPRTLRPPLPATTADDTRPRRRRKSKPSPPRDSSPLPRTPLGNITRLVTGVEGYTGPICPPSGFRGPVAVPPLDGVGWSYPWVGFL
ncbi:hypothetical protein PHLGIDRAFT_253688 [Phlebiopsis gigantea 11061_1 CR5-6]|uniref:Uncharacterized protein n=1 Tax=Phlebiopsis gigantea (strain 11061_1 CR5-6) TaxID=745531 RepID=A0A0C3S4U2_PHLG1|nr:hypothetical protein PHLGIDRAFT_253688 [Phlebiopsis gigantea 11061_1 CR5-6]